MPRTQGACGLAGDPAPEQPAPRSAHRPGWLCCSLTALCSVTKCKTLGMSCKGGKLREPVWSLGLTVSVVCAPLAPFKQMCRGGLTAAQVSVRCGA